jgi:hypothetical protein
MDAVNDFVKWFDAFPEPL